VLDSDNGGLGHRGVLVEDLLDLSRGDVVSAANDQVLLAVDDRVVAVGVAGGDLGDLGEPARGW
jgi:hypothetical protein